jgi:predicted small lipoprotein YifL
VTPHARIGAAALAALLLSGGPLAGCGQKGPLYLPSQKKTKVPPSPTQPAPQATPDTRPDTQPEAEPGTPPGSPPPQSSSPAPS